MVGTSQAHPGAATDDPGEEESYRRPAEVVLQALGSSVDGLSSAEGARRLAEVGPNELARPAEPSVLKLALVQLRDPEAHRRQSGQDLAFCTSSDAGRDRTAGGRQAAAGGLALVQPAHPRRRSPPSRSTSGTRLHPHRHLRGR
jgi:hypothetical protein